MGANFRKSKGCFVFYNANPAGKLSAGDCVIRAIAKATNESWDKVFLGLCAVGLELKDVASSKPVYTRYLQNLGYHMQRQPRKYDNTKYTTEEFAQRFNSGTYIVSLANHLSVIINGKIYDTWDCSNKSVGNYWVVSR